MFTNLNSLADMMSAYLLAFTGYVALNLLVFLTYWHDKSSARNGGWRIRESTLLWLAAVGGSVGAVLAQRLLRHKTRKEPFRTILLAILICHIALFVSIAILPKWPTHAMNVLRAAL